MISRAFARLSASFESTLTVEQRKTDIETVSAILLVEIARADHNVDTGEQQAILDALSSVSTLSEEELRSVVSQAMSDAQATLSLHEHVSFINTQLAKEDKISLVEHMWRVAVADGDIDRYEEYTIRKLCDLIHVKHRDFMQAKHRAIGE